MMYSQSNKILEPDPDLLLSHLLELRCLMNDQTVSNTDYNDINYDDVKKLKIPNLEVHKITFNEVNSHYITNYLILYGRLPYLSNI